MSTSPQPAEPKVTLPTDATWRYTFLGLMRKLSAQHPDLPAAGEALRPQEEFVRLGQKPSLTFATREIADIEHTQGQWHIRLMGLGMLGPNGGLPLHMTDFVRERSESHRDPTLTHFLDLFHHRHLTSLYRAWGISQSTAALDRSDDERFSTYIDALGNTESGNHHVLPAHARLSASAHLVRQARNPDGLANTLAHFFDVPIAIEEFAPRWVDMDPQDRSCLGSPGASSTLGEGAFAGQKFLDRQHQFRIVIGPLSLNQYMTFTPSGHNLPLLREWVRAFVGFEFGWEVELKITPDSVPASRLGASDGLGWSTWMGQPDPTQVVTGMRFEPETTTS